MKITSIREDLLKAITTTASALSLKPSLPVLNNFLMEAKSGTLEITATNLDTTINKKIPVKVVKEGKVTVPARLLVNFCQTAASERIELEVSGDKATVSMGKANVDLATIPAEEFPPTAKFEPDEEILVPKDDLIRTAAEVGVCASPEDGRPVLTGVLIKAGGKNLDLVATDGYRLAKKTLKASGSFQSLFPARVLVEAAKALSEDEDEDVKLANNKERNQTRLQTRNLTVLSRTLDGEYPNYEQIIPSNFQTECSVKTRDFQDAIKLTSILAKELGSVVNIEVDKSAMRIAATTEQVGQANTEFPAKTSGDPIKISFNSRFLTDTLNALKDEDCVIKFSGPTSAAILQTPGKKGLFHVIMPVRTQS